jgi:hypothetical protein
MALHLTVLFIMNKMRSARVDVLVPYLERERIIFAIYFSFMLLSLKNNNIKLYLHIFMCNNNVKSFLGKQ